MVITKQAFAKINLTLDVLNKRDDGYHDIVSVMQSLSLSDVVTIREADSGVSVSWDLEEPTDTSNTAYRAALRMIERYGISCGLDISIAKRIPVSAGLGGGSADAAAVIHGLNELFDLNIDFKELIEVGAEIGADVPFCLTNGAALAEGIGERLVRLNSKLRCYAVLVKPDIVISTREIYSKIDKLTPARRPRMDTAVEAVEAGDLENLGQNLYNVMELVTAEEYPIIKKLKREMLRQGARGTLMSGSGPTVYGLFESGTQARNAASFFNNKYSSFGAFASEFIYPR